MRYARLRFTSALGTGLAGAALTAGAFTLTPGAERWLATGVGGGVVVLVAVAFAGSGRGAIQRSLDLPLALVCIWAIVCSRAIEAAGAGSSPDTAKWLNFSAGAAIASFGLVGLLVHEWGVGRDLRWAAERTLVVRSGDAEPTRVHTRDAAMISASSDLTVEDRYQDALSRAAR